MSQPTKASRFDGFTIKLPKRDQVEAAAKELREMFPSGWEKADTCMILKLDTKVKLDSQLIRTHLTIMLDDIDKFASGLLQQGVEGAAVAFKKFMAGVNFHVTIEQGDDIYDPSNPRWHSDTRDWTPVTLDKKAPGLEDAVAEAKKKLGR